MARSLVAWLATSALLVLAGSSSHPQPWRHCAQAAFHGAWQRMDPSQLPPEPQIHTRGTRIEDKDDHWLWVWDPVPEGCPQPRTLTREETAECWRSKRVVFMGCSTTRGMYAREASKVGSSINRLVCNRTMGYGCYDCVHGCRNEYYWYKRHDDWTDEVMSPPFLPEFSWKPDMLTTDDLIRLKRLQANQGTHPVDAFVVSKGLHDIVNWREALVYGKHRETLGEIMLDAFWDELEDRAEELANTLRAMFPHAKLFWRDAFFNLLEPAAEGLLAVLRNRTNKYFKAAGFIMIS
eukprot:EG_transcript_21643